MSFVIGTAGHIDHGKSTLITALTGIDPDRLAEEKRRGMTIDLGFAHLRLPSGTEVGVVDVPGHARFIRNMLAGVHGLDAVILVVAADEGVRPQTLEHLQIIDLLEVPRGLVALTKIDLVDADWLEVVAAEVSATLEKSVLSGATIVPVSAVTRQGLDELLAGLDGILAGAKERADVGRPRLPIDRAFTMSGFGTVVTASCRWAMSSRSCRGAERCGCGASNSTVGRSRSHPRAGAWPSTSPVSRRTMSRGAMCSRRPACCPRPGASTRP